MNVTLDPIVDENGHLRPDLDFRDVPLATMARYLGCSTNTLYRRVLAGELKKGVRKHGKKHFFQPRAVVA